MSDARSCTDSVTIKCTSFTTGALFSSMSVGDNILLPLREHTRLDLPTMLQYRTAAENDSCYNTPPTFGIYLMGRVPKQKP